MTSNKIKRGHNFGVVYFTPNSLEEELQGTSVKKSTRKVNKSKQEMDNEKREKLHSEVLNPVKGREHVACGTDAVTTTIRPKPLTFEIEVQTEDYLDRPISPLTRPSYTNPEKGTQVEDGELFHFDDEVEPILSVLISKTLDQSRMEVLEEEEILEMNRKQRYFEELRNRELMEVQKLEDAEKRRKEEISRRYNQQKERTELTKINQKKLMARCFAKEYLSKIRTNCLSDLINKGVFQKEILRQIHYDFVPYVYNKVENQVKDNLKFVKNITSVFRSEHHRQMAISHKQSLEREVKRKLDEEERRRQEKERRKEERRRRVEEEARLKKEQEREELKSLIYNELLKSSEMVEEIPEIYDPTGNHLLGKKYSSLTGGILGQWALAMSTINSYNPDDPFMNIEKLNKSLELFMPKFPPVSIYIPNELLEEFKLLDQNINTVEDLVKTDDKIWVSLL